MGPVLFFWSGKAAPKEERLHPAAHSLCSHVCGLRGGPEYMPPEKTDLTAFAAPAAKLCGVFAGERTGLPPFAFYFT